MKIIKQLCIVLLICLLGDSVSALFSLPISGSVVGMVLLFALLCLKIIKPEDIQELADFFLKHMVLFLIPACVGVITTGTLLKGSLVGFLTICVFCTVLVMLCSGYTVQLVQKLQKRRKKEEDSHE